jgi:hypothetical protein
MLSVVDRRLACKVARRGVAGGRSAASRRKRTAVRTRLANRDFATPVSMGQLSLATPSVTVVDGETDSAVPKVSFPRVGKVFQSNEFASFDISVPRREMGKIGSGESTSRRVGDL